MSTNVSNPVAFLRTSREFPEEIHQLTVEINKAYLDIANAVNSRTIGIFSANKPSLTGNNWFYQGGRRQETLRQIYTFSSSGNITHGINTSQISGFVNIYGSFTDGTNWYPLPYVDVTNANNQVSVSVTSSNIVISSGAGSPPSITKGFVILEWLSQI